MEASIDKLSGANSLSTAEKAELAALQHEFAYVQKSKKDYVELHPEHRKLVYPAAAQGNADASGSSSRFGAPLEDDGLGLYAPDGRLRRPELSAYYDATFNPFGVPPPGMPYKARRTSSPLGTASGAALNNSSTISGGTSGDGGFRGDS